METLKVDIQNDQERKVLLAFLDSLNYHYSTDSDVLTDEQIKELANRKADFLSGKTTSRSWDEIKKRYEGV